MLKTLIQKTLLGTLPFTLVACGGGSGGGSSTEIPSNNIPVAVSGADQNVLTGQTVTLDGASSYDPDQDEISYSWSFSNLPSSSQSTLSDESAVNPIFVPDIEGTYILNLMVYDGKDYSNDDEVTIIVTQSNSVPVANAGVDQDVSTQSVVTLDGSVSSDADGDNLTYQWSIFSTPAGSNIQLSNATSVKPSFTPDIDGQYQVRLIVNDGQDNSAFDEIVITSTTANSAPIANAGNNRDVNTYELVGLNGSNSSDANGDTLSYAWTFVSRPDGSSATLQNANSSLSDFTPDFDGDYTISLVVNDGQVSSDLDNVVITATTANAMPLADAGRDQVQFDLSDITLSGSGSSDADGDLLTYQWSIQSAPNGSSVGLSGVNSVTTTLSPDLYGDYVLSLIVNDGSENSLTDNVTIQVIPPEQKSAYLANNLNAYVSSAASSSVNGYVQSGSQFTLVVQNRNSQAVDWTKFEVRDADGSVFASTTDSTVLSNSSLTANESSSIQITLSSSQRKPFTATFSWSDPLAGNAAFQTTLEFAN